MKYFAMRIGLYSIILQYMISRIIEMHFFCVIIHIILQMFCIVNARKAEGQKNENKWRDSI